MTPDLSVRPQSGALVSTRPGNSDVRDPSPSTVGARPDDPSTVGLTRDTGRAVQSKEPPLFEADTGRLCLSRSLEFASTRVSFPCFLLLLAESDTAPEYSHLEHLKLVFKSFRREILFINRAKCSFIADQTIFLGFIVSANCNVIFEPGDLVWLHLRPEQFPSRRNSKLHQPGDEPFRLLVRLGMNAYKLNLMDSYGVHPPFNVSDLSPSTVLLFDDPEQTGTFATQEGEGDAPPPPMSPPEVGWPHH